MGKILTPQDGAAASPSPGPGVGHGGLPHHAPTSLCQASFSASVQVDSDRQVSVTVVQEALLQAHGASMTEHSVALIPAKKQSTWVGRGG